MSDNPTDRAARMKRPVLVFPPGEFQFKRTLVLPSDCVVIGSASPALQDCIADELDAHDEFCVASPADRVGEVAGTAPDDRGIPGFRRAKNGAT